VEVLQAVLTHRMNVAWPHCGYQYGSNHIPVFVGISALCQRVPVKEEWRKTLSLVLLVATKDYETRYSPREVRSDSTATVTAVGSKMGRKILVNGISMTSLTRVTKMIAHLPIQQLELVVVDGAYTMSPTKSLSDSLPDQLFIDLGRRPSTAASPWRAPGRAPCAV